MKSDNLRPRNSVFSRAGKLWKSSGTWSALVSRVAEEVYCRICDRSYARRFLGLFSAQREPEKWVFIVGCYNSGTTLLQKVLSAHPSISGMPREGVRFTDALSNLELNNHHMFWDESWRTHAHPPVEESASVAAQVKKDWSIFWAGDSNVFLEKSIANTARIDWLNQHFPNAHFIALYRNGYCIAEGLHRRSHPPSWLVEQTGEDRYPLKMAAEQWQTANDAMLAGLEHVDKKIALSFEDFVANPVEKTNEILRLLDVPVPEASMNNGVMQVGSKDFTVRNPNAASLKRLGDRQLEIEDVVEPMMTRLADMVDTQKKPKHNRL